MLLLGNTLLDLIMRQNAVLVDVALAGLDILNLEMRASWSYNTGGNTIYPHYVRTLYIMLLLQ